MSGPSMTVLIRLVTYAWPRLIDAGGTSLSAAFGVTHETAGRLPSVAAFKKLERS